MIADIVEAYLNANMDDFVAMKIERMMIYFMFKADPKKYSKHVYIFNSKKVLYVKTVKAL